MHFVGEDGAVKLGNGASDTVFVGYGDNTIAGNGRRRGDQARPALGNGAGDVVNDSGNHNTITVGNGADTVYGGANDTITVGNGHDQLFAAPGDIWTVGRGQDTFTFNAGFGANTITDFNASHDVLQLASVLFPNYAAVMADTRQVGGNTVITDHANDSVTLIGVEASRLTASNFKFT